MGVLGEIVLFLGFAVFVLVEARVPVRLSPRPDPCTALNASSVCLESHFCSATNGGVWISCDRAYVMHSSRLPLRPVTEPPFLLVLNFHGSQTAKRMGKVRIFQKTIRLPTEVTSSEHHKRLMSFVRVLDHLLKISYPLILADLTMLARLVANAKRMAEWIHATQPSWKNQYVGFLVDHPEVASILTNLQKTNEYFMSLDPCDPVSSPLFTNMVPIFHAWIWFHRWLSLPPPFIEIEFLPFLTAATNFESMYQGQTHGKSTWMLYRDHSDMLTRAFIPNMNDNDPMLVVSDYLGIGLNEPLNIPSAYTQFINDAATRLFLASCDNSQEYVYTVNMFMRHTKHLYPQLAEQYCESTRAIWLDSVPHLAMCVRLGHPHSDYGLLEYFRNCGIGRFDVQTRTQVFLPAMLSARSRQQREIHPNTTDSGGIREFLFTMGRGHPFGFQLPSKSNLTSEDIRLLLTRVLNEIPSLITGLEEMKLTKPIDALRAQTALHGVGVLMAILTLRADTALKELISTKQITSLYLDNNSVRKGFCRILNCQVFEVLFDKHELPEMFQFLSL